MELVTLEDNMGSLAEAKMSTITSSSPSMTSAKTLGISVPHFSWMYNDDVLYDAVGSNNTKVPGSAFGLIMPQTTNASGFGVFRTKHNRPVIVVTDWYSGDNKNPMWQALENSGAFGPNPERIDVERGGGRGYIERYIFKQMRDNVMQKLISMENAGPSNRPIVINITGRPSTWKRGWEAVGEKLAKIAIDMAMQFAAPYVNDILGLDAGSFLKMTPTVQGLVENRPVQVSELAAAAGLVLPPDLRGSLRSAVSFYEDVKRGDYAAAAKQFGIDTSGVNKIMKDYAAGVSAEAAKASQSIYIMDTINQVRGAIRSGTAKQEIINFGTVTKSPALQNMMMAAMGTPTAAIPKAVEVAGLMASETEDLQGANEWRAMYQIAHGTPITSCSIDRIALRGLVERARTLFDRGVTTMNMPDIVPKDKRECFADEVRSQTGVKVGAQGISPTVALLGVAGVAGIAYFAMRK